MRRIAIVAVSILLILPGLASGQECLGYRQQVTLTGQLITRTFPGAPNYESVARGDEPEKAAVVVLDAPICVSPDSADHVNDSEREVTRVQLVRSTGSLWITLRPFVGHRVRVVGILFHSITGHHHTRVLLDLRSVRAN